MTRIAALDVGGANTKGCLARFDGEGGPAEVQSDAFCHAVYRDPEGLEAKLAARRRRWEQGGPIDALALTTTAELCDVFSGKAEGVLFILAVAERAFAGVPLWVWTVEGRFAPPKAIRAAPLRAAAANWLAGATAAARSPALAGGPALWADMGSTTTDLLALGGGAVQSHSRTDLDRLARGELLYTGALRTPLNALCGALYVDGAPCPPAQEYFACTADLYRFLGRIDEAAYDIPTPDGAGRDRAACGRRLARLVAADPEELGEAGLRLLALQLESAHRRTLEDALLRMLSRGFAPRETLLVTAGQGAFLLEGAAAPLGMKTTPWHALLPGARPETAATAHALALLLYNDNMVK